MDPEIAVLLPGIEADTATRLEAFERDVNGVRQARLQAAAATQGTGPAVARQHDLLIPGPAGDIPVRVFVPHDPAGAYLHLHGGGWVLGSHTTQDPMLRTLAVDAGVAVVSVGYRLAPEHPFPAGLDDCVAASRWLETQGTSLGLAAASALAIGGESAGANLAVATLLRRRDELDPPYRAAVLTFGVFSALFDLPSVKRMWDVNLVLSGPIMEWFGRCYLAGRDPRHPYVSPLFADLKGMPPAIFTVGTLDHLYSDSLVMTEAWRKAGNACELHEYLDGPHGFTSYPVAIARQAHERINVFVRRSVGREALTRANAAAARPA